MGQLLKLLLIISGLLCEILSQQDEMFDKHINEQLPADSIVMELPEVYPNVHYSIVDDNAFFQVKGRIIKTKKEIDREALHFNVRTCRMKQNQCFIQFIVQASSASVQSTQFFNVRVFIEDINDNPPVFKLHAQNLAFQENGPNGTQVRLELATDRDSEKFGVREYRLEEMQPADNFPFEIISKKIVSTHTDVYLVQRGPLDREQISQYRASLVAVDGGETSKTARLQLNIEVTDINDHAPVWLTTLFNISIAENTPEEAEIFRFVAQDADFGENSALMYEMAGNHNDESRRYFYLEASTGVLRIRRRLDHEQHHRFEILVIAKDSAKHPQSVSATLFITIIDQNDRAPIIKVIPKGSIHLLQIDENQSPGQVIATILVTDNDDGLNGKVTCSIDSKLFMLKALTRNSDKSYGLYSNTTFDREKCVSYRINITCNDFGTPHPLFTSSIHQIEVLDENDNKPFFQLDVYQLYFPENQPIYSRIARLNASDDDNAMLPNGKLHFWLPDDVIAQNFVEINRENGVLRSLRIFDREETNLYTFAIYVRDLGAPSYSATSTVTLIISDENDHSPEWQSPLSMSVIENAPMLTTVGTVKALDKDEGVNGKITYSLEPVSNEFAINKHTGLIFTRSKNLDREKTATYELNVVAKDYGTPKSRSSSTLLRINLLDQNDCTPEFVAPRRQEFINISCDDQVNHIVTKIKAIDNDAGENGIVEYELPERDNYFEVDPISGNLMLIRKLDCAQIESTGQLRKIIIRATDRGSPSQKKEQLIHIVIKNSKSLTAEAGNDSENRDNFTDPNFTAIVGLVVATVILICILVVTICVLRSKTFVSVKAPEVKLVQNLSNGSTILHLQKTCLPNKTSVSDDATSDVQGTSPYYYTWNSKCYESNSEGNISANPKNNYQVIHFSSDPVNTYIDCQGIQQSKETLYGKRNQMHYSQSLCHLSEESAEYADDSFNGKTVNSLSATCNSSMDARDKKDCQAIPVSKIANEQQFSTFAPMLESFASTTSDTSVKNSYCTISFV